MAFAKTLPRPFVAMHIRRGDQLAKGLVDPHRSLEKAAELLNRVVCKWPGEVHVRESAFEAVVGVVMKVVVRVVVAVGVP